MNISGKNYKYVIEQKDHRTGKPRYYFWADRKQRVRMPEPYGSEQFDKYYNDLIASFEWREKRLTFLEVKKRELGIIIKNKLQSSKARAKKYGVPFDLEFDWAIERITKNDFKCELTGISFLSDEEPNLRTNPFSPSFDRVEPKLGYTKDNVRIVIYAVNVMLLDWGTDLFEKIVRSYERQKRTK